MAIQETKIDSSIATSESFPETCHYNIFRKNRRFSPIKAFHTCLRLNWKTTQMVLLKLKFLIKFFIFDFDFDIVNFPFLDGDVPR